MKNVLDRLTELAKDNPSPDVKQAMENTRRMSVAEGADVVEVHEGVAEGWKQTLRKFDPTIKARIRGKSQDQTNQGLDTIDQLAGMGLTSDDMVSRAMKPNTYFRNAERYAKLANKGVAEEQLDEGAIDKLKELYQSLVSKVRTIPNFKQYYDAAKLKQQEAVDAIKTSKNAEELKQKIAAIAGPAPAPVMAEFDGGSVRRPALKSGITMVIGLFDIWAAQVIGAYSAIASGAGMGVVGGLYLGVLGQVGCIGIALFYAIKATENWKRNQDVAEGGSSSPYMSDKQANAVMKLCRKGYTPDEIADRYPNLNKDEIDNIWGSMDDDEMAEGSRKAYLKHNNLVDLKKPLTGLEDEFNKFLRTHDPEVKQQYQQGIKDRIKTSTMAGPKGVLPEQSMTEGVNFAEMHRAKHTTLDEMLNELHDDINTFKQCGQMSEQLRDFMEVHHYGKKQLMDAAYGPVDELADMTKLAGVPGPIGQPDEELAESSGEMINGKEVDMYSLEVGGVDYGDSPDFVDAYFEAGSFVDGTPLSDNELEQLTHERGDLVSELASEHMIGAGDDARDRQRDLDMELEGVGDGDNGLASAHAKARQVSGEHGVAQHVNRDPESGYHRASDWYIDGETVGSYNMGKRYDDSGYIDEEVMPGEESDVAQKAQGIEAVSGKKINQMNPGEIKMAGQKVDAMGVTESKQMVDECGMMGGSMQPNTPANINISASAASGGEVAAMINDLLKLAGRPENADTHMHEPGVVAIDGTMDAGGAEELAAMLGGEEEVVDETGDAGGFADATTQPDALVYDENPVLTQTGVQKHTLGGYHNGDSPLAATTELEESLWRKFQNQ